MLLIEIFHLQMISYLFSFWKDSIIGYIVAFIVFFIPVMVCGFYFSMGNVIWKIWHYSLLHIPLFNWHNSLPSHNSYMYGNAFEAFIGAIYLDQGYERCKRFMEEKIFKNYIDLDKMSRKEVNFKSKLIEWSQKSKVEVSFELIEQFLDEDYNPMFHTEIRIEGISAGKGTGYSKKESQQNAAQAALKKIKNDASFKEQIEATKAQNHLPENTEETDELTEETLIEENLETILPVENPETDECKGE